MKIINGINRVGKLFRPVIALGVFDGVHRGHRVILEAAVREARRSGGSSVVVTFWPHPRGKESLYSLEHRLAIIAETGIDVCVVAGFTRRFARISADAFVRDVVCGKLRAYAVYVGEDYRFGRGAQGSVRLLKELSAGYGFRVRSFKAVRIQGRSISSTVIRGLIKGGELAAAARLLSRPVSVLGTVVKGGARAGRMGFPTANIDPHHEVIPPPGIYAVRIALEGRRLRGVCYIGSDPTLGLGRPVHVEVHIFNFSTNIYGRNLEVQFIRKIRSEKKFSSAQALIARIRKDILRARSILSHA